jgi:hypothetical protein
MGSSNEFTKDPSAVLDYTIDWEDWLCTGDTISTSTWTVPTGITEDSDTNTTTTATIWLSGGSDGVMYTVVNRIVTAKSRTDDRSLEITVEEK